MALLDVFICHTGKEKMEFVDILRILLKDYHRLTVFVDEWSLEPGADAPATMLQKLDNAAVAVVVFSPAFLTKKHPLQEVRRILEKRRTQPGKQQICLIFYGITVDKCCAMNVEGALTEYKQDVEDLCKITGIRDDQARYYHGELAVEAVKTVIIFLKQAGRLLPGYGGGPQCHLIRTHAKLFGREREVEDLLQLLRSKRTAAVVAGPGEGKTSLAAEAVQTMFDGGELPGGAYVVDLAHQGTSAKVAQHIASQLILQLSQMEVISPHEGTADLEASDSWDKLLSWLRRYDHSMLVVLENVESVLQNVDNFQVLMDITGQLLQCRSLKLLVNSRVNCLQELPTIKLAGLDSLSAVALLHGRTGKDVAWEAGQAERLIQLCHGNALLLNIIGGFVGSRRCSVQAALADAEKGGPLSLLQGSRYGGARLNERIKHADEWLLKHLTEPETEAIAKLSLFRGSISQENVMLMLAWELRGHSVLISDLCDAFILQSHAASSADSVQPRFNMHPIIWDFACRIRAAQPDEKQTASWQLFVQRMLVEGMRLAALAPSQGLGRLAEAMQILADEMLNFRSLRHILDARVAADKQLGLDHGSIENLRRLANALYDMGQPAEAAQLHRQVLDLREKLLGREHFDTLTSRNNLAIALRAMGQHVEAMQLERQVLELSEKVLGREHPNTLDSMNNLAIALYDMGQRLEAMQLHKQVLELREKVLGHEHRDTVTNRDNLAAALQGMGKHAEAAPLHRQVLKFREKVLGREHPHTLTGRNNLGEALFGMGEYAEAAQLHREVLKIWEKMLGREHPDTLHSMSNLANALLGMGQPVEAVQLQRQVLELREKVMGSEHPNVLMSRNNLAIALTAMGQHDEAAQLHGQVLGHWEKVLGHGHPDTLMSRNNLANALRAMGQHAKAAQLLRQVLELREKVLGREHPSTLNSRNDLAVALHGKGQHAEALMLHRQVLELTDKVLGREHPFMLNSMNNLAAVLQDMCQYAEAAQMQGQVLKLMEKVLGHEHPDTLTSRHNLANALLGLGQHVEAAQLYRQVLELREKVLGREHLDVLGSRNNLAVALQEIGQHAEAVQLFRQVLELRENMLGREHPDTLISRTNLASALDDMGQQAEATQLNRQELELREEKLGPTTPTCAIEASLPVQ